jgi:hypothetical protein
MSCPSIRYSQISPSASHCLAASMNAVAELELEVSSVRARQRLHRAAAQLGRAFPRLSTCLAPASPSPGRSTREANIHLVRLARLRRHESLADLVHRQ